MIYSLTGKITKKDSTSVVIECGGVGYLVFTSVLTSGKLPPVSETAAILTHLLPREDSIQLYGFFDESERNLFLKLISISGVGAKIAIGILSSISVEELVSYILESNIPAMQKLPGIGKKTAERLIFELKDKMHGIIGADTLAAGSNLIRQEAVAALVSLGYNRSKSEKSVERALKEDKNIKDAEKLIKLALKFALK
ncbi:MAG: Holliday junction branch migration protein RuvA [Candidatus Kapaibacterium sp.]